MPGEVGGASGDGDGDGDAAGTGDDGTGGDGSVPPGEDGPGGDGTTSASDGPASDVDGPVLLFDGVCNLCNGVVQFVIERDPAGTISFAPLQSAAGRRLLDRVGRDPGALDTVVLVDGGTAYTKSDAAIRVARHLGGVYRLAVLGRLVPRVLRDAVYDFVADNRYDWFGRREQCMVPTPELRDRFIEQN